MFALLSLVVCLAAQPHVCEVVTPDFTHASGAPVSFMECMTATGQQVAMRWLDEHPQYVLRKVQCSVATDADRLRDRIETPRA